jgi:hypothetical protein
MSRVLFDKNVPYSLKRHLLDHQVHTVEDEGWEHISNGELIGHAEDAGYRIILTCDQNIRYQQNMKDRKISMVVLGSNIWPSVKSRITDIAPALNRALPGSFEFIEIAPPQKRRSLSRVKPPVQ